jgi:hypothetical protein
MHELTVEEQHIARCQIDWYHAHTVGDGYVITRERDLCVGFLRAIDIPSVRARNDLQTTIGTVRRIEGNPSGDARARLYFKIEIVLMEGLPLSSRRLEVQHALSGKRFLTEQV